MNGWHKVERAAPLWKSVASSSAKATLKRVGEIGGRMFDENGLSKRGKDGEQYATGTSDLYRLANPIADREESDRPYEENVWVRAAIKAVAEGLQRTRFQILTGEANDEGSVPVEGHPLLKLLDSPNKITTQRGLWRAHAVDMKHDGEEVWFLMNGNGQPVESDPITGMLHEMPVSLVQVRGSLVEVKFDAGGMPHSYRYSTSFSKSNSATSHEFHAGSVVHFRDYDPYNIVRGLGDVNALEREIDLYFQAFRAMDGAVRNGGDPGGFIIYDHEVAPEEMQRRQDEADEEYAGPNQRRIKLLQSSAKYFPNTVKPSDMQYGQMTAWLRDSILAGLGVPPPCVGVYDSATYNNVETAYRELWTGSNGILALAANSADVLTNDLLRRMARVAPGSENLVAHFNSSGIEALRDDVGERLDRATEIAAKGIGVSFNEAIQMQGLEVESPKEGDRKWTSKSLEEVIESSSGDSDTGDDSAAAPESSLNGAQIAGMLTIIEQITSGAITKGTAVQIIVAAFPFDEARVMRILRDVEGPSATDPPEPAGPDDGDGGGADGDEADESDSPEESDSANEGADAVEDKSKSEQSLSAATLAFARVEGETELDKKLRKRVAAWITAYEKEQLAHIRRIATTNGLRKLSALDETMNPEALTEEAWQALLLENATWSERLSREVRTALRDVYANAIAEAAGEVSAPLVSMTDPSVIEQLATQRIKLAEGVTSVTQRRVRNAIARVMASAAPPGNLREMVKTALPKLTPELKKVFGTKEARAATIAQTETGQAENTARITQYTASNVDQIIWVASEDEATRASHLAVHGNVITLGGTFDNGLKFPHDPAGHASEIVNCRCKVRVHSRRDPLDDPDIEIS